MEKQLIVSKLDMKNFDEMKEAYEKVLKNDAQGLKGFYQKNPDALFDRITACGDTIFHIAAYRESEEVLQVLVKLVPPSRKCELLKTKNIHGNTILHEVATTTSKKAAEILIRALLFSDGPRNHEKDIQEREEILADRNKIGETPLFRAAEYGNKLMVMYLAGEVERVGNLQKHYRRDDGLSTLHIAVIGQHFETAIWFLEKDPQLATYKDDNGKTSLHLLASMPTDFKSGSPTTGILKEFIYYCLPGDIGDDDETQLQLNLQNKDLEQGQPSKGLKQSERSKCKKFHCAISRCFAKGWKMIDWMWKLKKMHVSAVKLAKLLVRTDASWFESYQSEEGDTICLERKGGEESGKKSAASGMESAEPHTPLFIAASTGIVEIVEEILSVYPQAVEHINQTGQNVLHVAILHRNCRVFDFVKSKEETKRLVRGIDNHGCTILHYAADTTYYRGGTKSTPALKLQQEVTWFEDVKNQVPSHFTLHLNKANMTAVQMFENMHEKQLTTAQEWVKNTCQSCSTVAVLVATVVFAAAYTAPGGFLSADGRPILLEKPLYSFFTVMDVAGLASSLTSVVIFLSILTSSLDFKDFHHTLPRNLSLGFTFLFFSVTSTMLTFTATILLLVHLEKKWTATLTYAAAFLPICVFALFQFPLYHQYFVAAVKSIFDFLRRNLPGNWEFLQIKDN